MLEEDHKVEESSAVNNKEAFSVSLDALVLNSADVFPILCPLGAFKW